ncbi:MAG TPA: helix-turn-helix domain-containing protein, partial [Elusimicrobiales bacterium]|nr:helix-turn-helix domain-containing protein [Elusimicrobiales bacterium]
MKSVNSKIYKDVISRMKKARKEAGLTQKDAADRLKVTQPYISKIEACQLRVDILQLKKFAELYGRPLNYLLEDTAEALALAEESAGYSASGSGSCALKDPVDHINFAVRDPLNAVLSFSELLLKTELNQEQKQFVSGISVSSDELLRQVKEIVDFSKLEAGKIRPASQEFDLQETVEYAMRSLQSIAASQGIDILCFVDPC